MSISRQLGDREYQKFVESTAVPNKPVLAVANPDGSNIGGSSGGLTNTELRASDVQVSDGDTQNLLSQLATIANNLKFLTGIQGTAADIRVTLSTATNTIGTVTTVATVATVTTVASLTNQANIGGFGAQHTIMSQMNINAAQQRQQIITT